MATILDDARAEIRKEAARGAREAVMPLLLLALALSIYAATKKGR